MGDDGGGVDLAGHGSSLPVSLPFLETGSVYLAASPLRARSWRGDTGKCSGKRAAV